MNCDYTRRQMLANSATMAAASVANGCGLLQGRAIAAEAWTGEDDADEVALPWFEYPDQDLGAYATPVVCSLHERAASAKRVLVVVDYQNDFVDGGAFGRIQPALDIEDALYDVVRSYQEENDIVIYTMDTHPLDIYPYTREGTFNPPHCVPGTYGWEIHGRLAELLTPAKAMCVLKGTYGAATLPSLIGTIQAQGVAIRSIEFAGVSTTCRVLHNAILLYNFFPEIEMIFDSRTTASYSDEATVEQLRKLEGWGFVIKW